MCVAAGFGLPGLNALVKLLIADYHMAQIIWFRCVVHLGFMVVLFMPAMGPRLFASRRPWLQSARSLTQLVTFTLIWVALIWTPITTVTMVLFTGPLMLVALSVPFLGERVGPRRWAAVCVGFAGVLIVLRPGRRRGPLGRVARARRRVLLCHLSDSDAQARGLRRPAHDGGLHHPRRLHRRHGRGAVLLGNAAQHGGTGCCSYRSAWSAGSPHYFIIKAYQYAEASLVGPFDYSQLVGASLFGFLLFGEIPDTWTWVGAAVIIASGLYIAHREARLRRTAA